MDSNKLKLNEDKTEFIVFGSSYNLRQVGINSIDIGDSIIERKTKVRNFGLIMDSCLTFHDHITLVCKSTMASISMIYKIRNSLTEDATKTLVQSLVISKLDYCNLVYYELNEREIKRLQRVQNCAARLVKRVGKFTSMSPVLKSLHWLPIKYRSIFKILLITYKCLNGKGPKYLADKVNLYIQPQ